MPEQNDNFFQLINLEKTTQFLNENSNKKIRVVLFIIGLFVGQILEELNLNFSEMKEGMLIGLLVGTVWAAYNYKKQGQSGILQTQMEVSVFFIYITFFLLGAFVGYYAIKPLLTWILPNYKNQMHVIRSVVVSIFSKPLY